MTGPWIRWGWLWLSRVPALVLPVPVLFVAWLAFLSGWIHAEAFCAAVLITLVVAFVTWTARIALVTRRWLTQFGWRLP
ncbi:hypothetical protein ACTD5D_32200 [Nocardia takedensis]|uniref:hypothetical protein n=1 Tax=Nocardia takedensis TaxID=259390 RepID=UPI003F7595EE